MKNLTLTLLLFWGILSLYAQNDAQEFQLFGKNRHLNNQNFFEILEEYKNRPNDEISTEEFEKWEHFWKYRINPDGSFPKDNYLLEVYTQMSQQYQKPGAKRGDWKCIGPRNITLNGSWTPGIGRINVIVEDPGKQGVLYAGGPSGGLWRSTTDGKSWEPLTDKLSFLGVSAIAIDPNNAKIIYIATGDDDGGISPGMGVWKTTDGGKNWECTGKSSSVEGVGNQIVIDPSNSNNLWISTNIGLYYSSDGATNWQKATGIEGGVYDLQLKPHHSEIVYAATGEAFYRSENGGRTFNSVSISFPLTSKRICIAVTSANSNYVYVLGAHTGNQYNGIFRSEDSGKTFTEMNSNKPRFDSGKPAYALSLAVSDKDPEVVYRGCKNIYKSVEGGKGLTKITNWSNYYSPAYVHGNIHFLKVVNGKIYVGSDGGAFRSVDGGASFENLSTAGLITGQFMKITSHPEHKDAIVGGLMDNGGFYHEDDKWYNFFGDSGLGVAISRTNKNHRYGLIPKGLGFYISIDGTPGKAMASVPSGGAWATPIEESADGSVLSGGKQLYKFNYKENHWARLGEQQFENLLDIIEVAPSDNTVIYVADDRQMFVSHDEGATWESRSLPNQDFISSIEIDEKDVNKVWATSKGHVFRSSDGGQTWVNMSEGLLDIAINRIKKSEGELEELYLATDLGVMYRNKDMVAWESFNDGLVNIMVMDITINDKAGLMRAATLGRGIWESPIGPSVNLVQKQELGFGFDFYPNPVDNQLFLSVDNKKPANYQMEIWTVLGQKVEEVDLGYIHSHITTKYEFKHPAGIYILKLKNGEVEEAKRLIKK